MALAEAILVCLTDKPMSGYDLARAFDTSIGFFWHADHQQIYRELRKMKAAGLVRDEHVVQHGRPNKNLWTITDAGRQRIADWSRAGSDPASIKDELLVKLYALGHVDRTALRAQIADRVAGHKEQLELYEQILRKHYSAVDTADADQVGKYLGLQLGLRYERGWVEWCEEAMRALAALPDDKR
jgi:DNA-binding PadR family transcriptional regulator